MNDEIIRKLFIKAMERSFHENVQLKELSRNIHFSYERLEFSPSIKTEITDADMLRIHIDIALDNGDKVLFMKLTDQLSQIENGQLVGATL